MRSLAGLGAKVGARLLVLGDYWRADCDERTEIGWLVHRAKDRAEDAAARELAERFAGLAEALAEIPDGSERLVVPVPSMPAPADATGQVPLAGVLARSLAAAGAGEYRRDLLARTGATPRLRHVDPQQRAETAAAAGYRASGAAAGRHVVVVDDVILTGATVGAVAACLRDAGATSVTAAVAARTRLR